MATLRFLKFQNVAPDFSNFLENPLTTSNSDSANVTFPVSPHPLNLGGGPQKTLPSRPKLLQKKLFTKKMFQRTPWGGGKRRGVENLTNDTPPKRGFRPRLVRYVFQPPSGVSALFFLYKISTPEQTRSSFGGVQKFSGERVLWYVFLPPYVLHPPISRPKCFGAINFVIITKESLYKANSLACFLVKRDPPVTATLQRKSSGGIIFVIITKIITK